MNVPVPGVSVQLVDVVPAAAVVPQASLQVVTGDVLRSTW